MKIAIPMDDKNLMSGVCPSFGRAPYFLIYDVAAKETLFLDNSAAASQGGAGIKAAQLIVDQGVQVLLTPRCGENAEEVLKRADVAVYKSIPGTAQQNINALAAEQLSLLNEYHPGFHGHAQ